MHQVVEENNAHRCPDFSHGTNCLITTFFKFDKDMHAKGRGARVGRAKKEVVPKKFANPRKPQKVEKEESDIDKSESDPEEPSEDDHEKSENEDEDSNDENVGRKKMRRGDTEEDADMDDYDYNCDLENPDQRMRRWTIRSLRPSLRDVVSWITRWWMNLSLGAMLSRGKRIRLSRGTWRLEVAWGRMRIPSLGRMTAWTWLMQGVAAVWWRMKAQRYSSLRRSKIRIHPGFKLWW